MQSLYNKLVSYWNLQDASGSRLDLTGTGNTLTNNNVVTTTGGIVGAASNFVAASSQRLQLASNASIQGGNKDYTFAAWVQLASKPVIPMTILSKYSVTVGQSEYMIHWVNGFDTFFMQAYTATDNAIVAISSITPAIGEWLFVVGWVDSVAQTVSISVNALTVDTVALGAAPQAASAAAFVIGAFGVASGSYWDGKICEVARWDRVLTTQERLWLYNGGYGRTFPFDGRYSRELGRHMGSRRMKGL